MIPSQIQTMLMMIFGILTFTFIMFLPALLELKNPKDAGPRIITDGILAFTQPQIDMIRLAKMEEETKLDHAVVTKLTDIIAFLPNLET